MDLDLSKALDTVQDGVKETAEVVHVKTNEFHENYVSDVLPDMGKYGEAAKFAAEMVPGVAEYNAIKDGDWVAFAIAAGIDVAAVAAGAFTAGAGYAVVKTGAKAGAKVVTKEVAEAATKKAVKEVVEAGTEKVTKEVAEAGVEKLVKETAEAGAEKVAKETAETGTERTILEVGDKIDKTKFPEYIEEIEEITNRKILPEQKELLEKALKEKDYSKLSSEVRERASREFGDMKDDLIKEWEKMTGTDWPRYTEDIFDKSGDVARRAGQPYDAHHIIELSTGGPNKWWNLHPARFPSEHQGGIHAAGSMARKIFG